MGNLCSSGMVDADTDSNSGPHHYKDMGHQLHDKRWLADADSSKQRASPERRRPGVPRDGLAPDQQQQEPAAAAAAAAAADEQAAHGACADDAGECAGCGGAGGCVGCCAPEHHAPPPPPVDDVPFSWTKGELIGIGAFGRVFSALNNVTGELVAIKQVSFAKDEALAGRVAEHIRALEAEVEVLKTLQHENIVRYLGTESTADSLHIFLEYVPGGSIASLLAKFGPFPESVIRVYTAQLLRGLEYLHQRGIMHRDIKGANILIDKHGTVKLADFGASKKIEDLATVGSGSKSIRGTPYWMAPEVIKQTGHGRPADIWSLACTVIEMATGKPPWSSYAAPVAAMFQIASSKDPPPLPEHLSREAKDFLLLCFNRVARDRANATRLLKHPFVADVPLRQALPFPSTPTNAASGSPAGGSGTRGTPAATTRAGVQQLLEGQQPQPLARHSALHGARASTGVPASLAGPQGSLRQSPSVSAAQAAALKASKQQQQQQQQQPRTGGAQQARCSPTRQHPGGEGAPPSMLSQQRGDAAAVVTAVGRAGQAPDKQQEQLLAGKQQQQQQLMPSQQQPQQQPPRRSPQQSPRLADTYRPQHQQQPPQVLRAQPGQQQQARSPSPCGPAADAGAMTLVDWNPVSEPSWAPPYIAAAAVNGRRPPAADEGSLQQQPQQPHQPLVEVPDRQQNGINSKGKGYAEQQGPLGCLPQQGAGSLNSSRRGIGSCRRAGDAVAGSPAVGPLAQGRASSAAASSGSLAALAGGSARPKPKAAAVQVSSGDSGSSSSAAGIDGTAGAAAGGGGGAPDAWGLVCGSLGPPPGDASSLSSKRAQWESELYEELERHRKEQRASRAAACQAARASGLQQR